MSRQRLNQLCNLARSTATTLAPVLHFTRLQATPTLLRTRSRKWFGSSNNLASDFSEKSEALCRPSRRPV